MLYSDVTVSLGFSSKNYLRNQFEEPCFDRLEPCGNILCLAKQNKYHLIAYIPIIGAIIGIFKRIIPALDQLKYPGEHKTSFRFQIFRGTCETLGLGLLFLIPDIIVTIGRLCSGQWFKKPAPASLSGAQT